jgi:hypothetical protein
VGVHLNYRIGRNMTQQEAQREAASVTLARELNTEMLRLTAFLAPSTHPAAQTWWADLVGAQPETVTSKPGRGESQEAGALGNCTLTLSVQPGRVDWLLTKRLEENVLPETGWAGPFKETLDLFISLMTRWLENGPPLVRLAFGAIVHEPTQDRIAAYRKLAQYLPDVKIDPERSEDFFYQINRPRPSETIGTLNINRLSKWSSGAVVLARFALTKQQMVQQPMAVGNHSLRIELDLSTDPSFVGELPSGELRKLLGELERLAVELISKGDTA